jgi:GNAT superfamily N-acetyltransferase
MTIKHLHWDSELFNKRIGEITVDTLDGFTADLKDFDLIYVKSKISSKIQLSGFENTLTQIKVIFSKSNFCKVEKTNKNVLSLSDYKVNSKLLYDLAYESGKFSRFKLDKNFTQDQFRALYQKWIENSINKGFANDFLVYVEKDEIKGFISYTIDDNRAKIGLVAVHPKHQAKGLGTLLLQSVEGEIARKGIEILEIPTQLQNKKACSFYSKLGYKPTEKITIKHFWRI